MAVYEGGRDGVIVRLLEVLNDTNGVLALDGELLVDTEGVWKRINESLPRSLMLLSSCPESPIPYTKNTLSSTRFPLAMKMVATSHWRGESTIA